MKPITRGSMKPTTPEAEAAFALYFELITGASVAHEAGDLRGELVILSHALHVLSEDISPQIGCVIPAFVIRQ